MIYTYFYVYKHEFFCVGGDVCLGGSWLNGHDRMNHFLEMFLKISKQITKVKFFSVPGHVLQQRAAFDSQYSSGKETARNKNKQAEKESWLGESPCSAWDINEKS